MKRLVMIALLLASAHAFADDVSPEVQAKAEALLGEGNELFAKHDYEAALEKYRQALARWDHPRLRFNIAVTEIRLDRYLEAADELDAALRFGEAPFPAELYQQALDYQKLVAGRVGYLEASCKEPAAHVSLDGKPWLSCPQHDKRRVLAGEHVLIAEAPEMITVSRPIVVAGNSTTHETIELLPLASAVTLEYPTPRWAPWATLGGGIAIAASGVALYIDGGNRIERCKEDLGVRCPNGCDLALVPDLVQHRDRAMLEGTFGVSMMVGGGLAAVGGVVWASLNRPRRVLPTLELSPRASGAAASVGWRF